MSRQRKLGWIATRVIDGRQHFVGACLAIGGRQRGIERWLGEMAKRPGVYVSPYHYPSTLALACSYPLAPQARPGPDWAAIERERRL